MFIRHTSAPAERNRGPILQVLRRVLPDQGRVLEVASGTGQHVVHFAAATPQLRWSPSDPDPRSRWSIAAWVEHVGLGNVDSPMDLDTTAPWPIDRADAVVCINMVHISPWGATLALLQGAAGVLPEGGPLVLYGPFRVNGAHTSRGNEAFDAALQQQDPRWGVRDVEAVEQAAVRAGLAPAERVSMPANNWTLVLRRAAAGGPAQRSSSISTV